jgi:selenide,water dikinase
VACEEALAHGASAATDITGFGLAAHALEMLRGGGVGLRLWHDAIPFHTAARAMARRGVSTAMTVSNRTMTGDDVAFDPSLDEIERLLYFDPQTSGGLLASVPADRAEPLAGALRARGVIHAAVVGEVVSGAGPLLRVVASA